MRILLVIISAVIFFTSCEEKADFELNPGSNKYIIIEGIITNENIPKEVKLSYSVDSLNKNPQAVSGAQIFLSNGDTTYTLLEEPENSGIYKTDTSFIGVINRIYQLEIKSEGKEYSSEARMLPVSLFEKALYTFNEDTALYEISYVTENFSTQEAAMFVLSLDWSGVSGYENLAFTENHAELYFYSLKTIDVNEIFAPAKEKIYFPKGTIINEKKYSLTPEHEKFIRSILMETEWNGGFFDVAEGNVYTNISGGALGFFGASSVYSINFIVK